MTHTASYSNLDFIFTPNGFITDVAECEPNSEAAAWKVRFDADRFAALYQLGFSEYRDWFSPSMLYLFRICDAFIKILTSLPECSVDEKLRSMLKNADVKSPRIIQDQALEDIFGVL